VFSDCDPDEICGAIVAVDVCERSFVIATEKIHPDWCARAHTLLFRTGGHQGTDVPRSPRRN